MDNQNTNAGSAEATEGTMAGTEAVKEAEGTATGNVETPIMAPAEETPSEEAAPAQASEEAPANETKPAEGDAKAAEERTDDAAIRAKKKLLKARRKKEIRKRRAVAAIILLLIVVIIMLLFRSCGKVEKDAGAGSMVIDTDATDEQIKEVAPFVNRNVYFSGIVDSEISRTGSVQLLNDKQNEDFLMKFVVKDDETGETLYESDLVPSGKAVYWVPGETLEPGTHSLTVEEIPYFMFEDGSYTTLSVGRNNVKITII